MVILDTDHLSVFQYPEHPRCESLTSRLQQSNEPAGTTVITWEEQLRGWLAEIKRFKTFQDQVRAYGELAELSEFHRRWHMLSFDVRAAQECNRLRKLRVRIGTQDLKIAAIALVHGATLLSANLRDFQKVPGLRVENWIR